MEKEYLILKWLNDELNSEELEAFKMLEDYDELISLTKNVEKFRAPDFNSSEELSLVLPKLKSARQAKSWFKPLLRVAAILVVGIISVYFYTTNLNTTVETLASQKTNIDLPDHSQVAINASSILSYKKNNWNNKREVILDGEAFFKVAKGSTFDVITDQGVVTVFGTQFNVKEREHYFEVICYEGLVGVTHNNKQQKLEKGQSFLIIDGKLIAKEKEKSPEPSWLNNESEFKSIPYKAVLAEFERQYNVTIEADNIDLNQLFTGNFTHDDYHIAIQAITLPLHLTHSKNENTITLKRE